MKIIITGATGFVGAHLVRHFAQVGHEVIAIGRQRQPPPALLQYAHYHCADITSALPKLEADVCIHVAALASDRGSYEAFLKANVFGTQHVFEATNGCKQFVFISSASVYPLKKGKIKEEDNYGFIPDNFYGKTKRLAEQYLESKTDENRTVFILRPRAIYGTKDRVLLPRILNLVKANRLWRIGNMQVEVSLTHINNLIHAISCCLQQSPAVPTTLLNIADKQTYTLSNIVDAVRQVSYGNSMPSVSLPVRPIRFCAKLLQQLNLNSNISMQAIEYVTNDFVLDISKAQAEIGYQPQLSFTAALPEIADWVHAVGIQKVKKAAADLTWYE